jgi:hypothetical protein
MKNLDYGSVCLALKVAVAELCVQNNENTLAGGARDSVVSLLTFSDRKPAGITMAMVA